MSGRQPTAHTSISKIFTKPLVKTGLNSYNMPNCFQLFDKSSSEVVSLISVDERICKEVYNVEPHSKYWGSTVFNWYDTIGFTIAMGKSLDQVRDHYVKSDVWLEELPIINKVLDFLEDNYTTRSFYESSSRN
jgi:hypothetical protein